MKTIKGMPTDLNLSSLYHVMLNDVNDRVNIYRTGIVGAGATVFANQISPPSVAGVRRCLKFGLLTVEGKNLRLTELGESAMCGWAMDFGRSWAKHIETTYESAMNH